MMTSLLTGQCASSMVTVGMQTCFLYVKPYVVEVFSLKPISSFAQMEGHVQEVH
jgi:hypothetical protein